MRIMLVTHEIQTRAGVHTRSYIYAIETCIHSVSSHCEKPANVTIINDRFLLHDAVASFRARAEQPGTSVDRNRHATRLFYIYTESEK